MKLLVSIGKWNEFQSEQIERLQSIYDLEITTDSNDKAELILASRWDDAMLHTDLKAFFVASRIASFEIPLYTFCTKSLSLLIFLVAQPEINKENKTIKYIKYLFTSCICT